MALFLGYKGGDVLSWRATKDLFAELDTIFTEKSSFILNNEKMDLLREFRDSLTDEIAFEERFTRDLNRTFEELERAEFEDQLQPLFVTFQRMAREYFEKRGSVIALQGICNAYHDAVLRKILQFAEEGMVLDELGRPPVPYCWLVSGAAGRSEQALNNMLQPYLVYDCIANSPAAYFEKLSYRITTILKKTGLITGGEREFIRKFFWRGSREDWRQWLVRELDEKRTAPHFILPALPSLSTPFRPLGKENNALYATVAAVADLRPLTGDEALSTALVDLAYEKLASFRETAAFDHLARQVTVSPVALNMFGWFKVEKRGKHRGDVDIERHALSPLVMNIGLFALKYDIRETNTLGRIRELLQRGRLNVDLAERVVSAYHEINLLILRLQMGEGSNEGAFISPEELSEDDSHKLKQALETVINLQKITHHDFTEQI